MAGVNFTKDMAPVSFEKREGVLLDVTLNWSSRTDVDLACMYELTDGRKSVVQALAKDFGSLGKAPFVQLSGDDRSGGTEKMTVNMTRANNINRLLFFAYVYEGGTWKDVKDAEVEVNHSQLGSYVIQLDGAKARSCALVDFQNQGDGALQMTRLEHYFKGSHEEIDKHYGWPNLSWRRSSK